MTFSLQAFTRSASFQVVRSPRAVLPPFTWSADRVDLQLKDYLTGVLSGTIGTKITYQMKAERTWEKDGKSAVSTWEKGGKAKNTTTAL